MRNLLLSILLGICIMANANDNKQYDSKILDYENINTDIFFDINSLSNIVISNDLFEVTDTTLSNVRTLQKVDSNLIEMLIRFKPINRIGLRFAREQDYYFIGQANISSDFDSFLFMQTWQNQDDFISKDIYLVNLKNGYVKSVIQVFDYYDYFDGISGFSHTYFDGGELIYKKMELSTDVDVIEPWPTGPEIHYAKFSFDQQGYVVIK